MRCVSDCLASRACMSHSFSRGLTAHGSHVIVGAHMDIFNPVHEAACGVVYVQHMGALQCLPPGVGCLR